MQWDQVGHQDGSVADALMDDVARNERRHYDWCHAASSHPMTSYLVTRMNSQKAGMNLKIAATCDGHAHCCVLLVDQEAVLESL